MSNTITQIIVFIASPSDVKDLRRIVRKVAEEINKDFSERLNYSLRVVGQEEIQSKAGRPQTIINESLLNKCDLFIGILWKRWGTEPGDEKFTSGFEEEFITAFERRDKTKSLPEISLYFKNISSDDQDESSEYQRKIKDFKGKFSSKVYYVDVLGVSDFESSVRSQLTEYVLNRFEKDKQKQVESSVGGMNSEEGSAPSNENDLTMENQTFIKGLLNKIQSDEGLNVVTSAEVARFRLLANSVTKDGNQEKMIGVHDANILYVQKKNFQFGDSEIQTLVEVGLQNLTNRNTPIWYWYKQMDLAFPGLIWLDTMFLRKERVSVNALKAITIANTELFWDENYPREGFLRRWFDDLAPQKLRIAALDYLIHHGLLEDTPYLEAELERTNTATNQKALEALLSIRIRYGDSSVIPTVNANSTIKISPKLILELKQRAESCSDEDLNLLLGNINPFLRTVSAKILWKRAGLSKESLEKLLEDESALVRKVAIKINQKEGKKFTLDEIQKILVKFKKDVGLGLLGRGLLGGVPDEEGKKLYDKYVYNDAKKMNKEDLEMMANETAFRPIASEILYKEYFEEYCDDLRKEIAGDFEEFYSKTKKIYEDLNSSPIVVQREPPEEIAYRKNMMEKGLDILAVQGSKKDLELIRNAADSNFVAWTPIVLSFFERFGEWEDIPRILNAKNKIGDSRLFGLVDTNPEWKIQKAKALHLIGKDNINKLLKNIPDEMIMAEIISLLSSDQLKTISEDLLLKLLGDKYDKVREYLALKCVEHMTPQKLGNVLAEYMKVSTYYNVIFWLDFGINVTNRISLLAVKSILEVY